MSFFSFYPPSGGANPSVGTNGVTAPTSSTEVGGINPSGNLQPLQTDSAGNLLVSLSADPIDPLGVNIEKYGGVATTLGQKAMAASIPVTIASDQSAVPITAASLPLPTGASTAANQVTINGTLTNIEANQTNGAQMVQVSVIPLPPGASTAALQTNGNTSLSTILAQQTNGTQITQVSSSALPTGAATSSLQSNVQGGITGQTAGTSSELVGGIYNGATVLSLPVGSQASIQLDSKGSVKVTGNGTAGTPDSGVLSVQGISGGTAIPISGSVTATNTANGNTGSAVPTQATQVGGSDGANLRALSVDATGNLNVNNISGTVSLPTGAATSANQTNGTQQTQLVQGGNTAAVSSSGELSVIQSSSARLNATVSQSTAGNLNAAVIGTGTAGSPSLGILTVQGAGALGTAININGNTAAGSGASTGLLTVQGNASGTPIPISGTVTASGTVAATQSGTWNITNISGTVSLPTGAATAANQTNASQKTQIVDGSGNVIASTSNALNVNVNNSIAQTIKGTVIANSPIQNVYSSTNITTSAYVQLVASTSNTINTLHIFDSSGQAMILGIGGAGSEVTTLYVPPGGDTYTLNIPSGSRLAYKALTATANSGYLLMSFLE